MKSFLEVDNFRFDLMWLRDNCRCEECFEFKILERNLNILDIPDDISCKEHSIESGELLVECKFAIKHRKGKTRIYEGVKNYFETLRSSINLLIYIFLPRV